MSIGFILLLAVGLLILFGAAQRVLDRMRLTDRQALLFVAAILVGGWIPDIPLGPVSVNLGGAVVPLILCIMLLVKADTAWERVRALIAAVASGTVIFLLGRYLPAEPENMFFDINYLYGLAAGAIAYLLGRSRRAAFIAGVLGVILADVTQGILTRASGYDVPIRLGTGGVLDAVVISGLLAVILAETVGELWERIRGGDHPHQHYEKGEFVTDTTKGVEGHDH